MVYFSNGHKKFPNTFFEFFFQPGCRKFYLESESRKKSLSPELHIGENCDFRFFSIFFSVFGYFHYEKLKYTLGHIYHWNQRKILRRYQPKKKFRFSGLDLLIIKIIF